MKKRIFYKIYTVSNSGYTYYRIMDSKGIIVYKDNFFDLLYMPPKLIRITHTLSEAKAYICLFKI